MKWVALAPPFRAQLAVCPVAAHGDRAEKTMETKRRNRPAQEKIKNATPNIIGSGVFVVGGSVRIVCALLQFPYTEALLAKSLLNR